MRGHAGEALSLAVIHTAFAVMLLSGHEWWAGAEIVALAPGHGINGGDLLVLGLWLTGMALLARIGLTAPASR